jgi:hypothetical protein
MSLPRMSASDRFSVWCGRVLPARSHQHQRAEQRLRARRRRGSEIPNPFLSNVWDQPILGNRSLSGAGWHRSRGVLRSGVSNTFTLRLGTDKASLGGSAGGHRALFTEPRLNRGRARSRVSGATGGARTWALSRSSGFTPIRPTLAIGTAPPWRGPGMPLAVGLRWNRSRTSYPMDASSTSRAAAPASLHMPSAPRARPSGNSRDCGIAPLAGCQLLTAPILLFSSAFLFLFLASYLDQLDHRSVRVGAADEALLATVPEFKHNRLSPEFDALAPELFVIFCQRTRTQCDPAHPGMP